MRTSLTSEADSPRMTRSRLASLAPLLATCLGLVLASTLLPAGGSAAPSSSASGEQRVSALPGGGKQVFGRNRFLFAYYGFAHPSTTFVLGRTNPDRAFAKMERQGRKLLRDGERLLPVYELVVTVADADPGADGDYAHDTLHSKVQEYIDAAHRNGALLVLDLQPGRASFLDVAKRWEWALVDPWVGLGLDIEWQMDDDQLPGRDIGSVSAREINKVSAWLSDLVRAERLPEKVLLFHQYTRGNVKNLGRVRRPEGVAVVQHVDAPGSPATKQATYDRVARPDRFVPGFMVFLDADQPVMGPRAVRGVDDAIRFVSHQ